MIMDTPKEKAEELRLKYVGLFQDDTDGIFKVGKYVGKLAKKCAIISVEETINELNHHSDLHGYYQDDKGRQSVIERISYWRKVKEEIEKL